MSITVVKFRGDYFKLVGKYALSIKRSCRRESFYIGDICTHRVLDMNRGIIFHDVSPNDLKELVRSSYYRDNIKTESQVINSLKTENFNRRELNLSLFYQKKITMKELVEMDLYGNNPHIKKT